MSRTPEINLPEATFGKVSRINRTVDERSTRVGVRDNSSFSCIYGYRLRSLAELYPPHGERIISLTRNSGLSTCTTPLGLDPSR